MNERGPRGFNPEENNRPNNPTPERERLTSEGTNPYANSGANFMPEGNGGGADNPRNTERPWDPIDTPIDSSSNVINIMDIPAKNEAQLKAKAAWNQVFGGRAPRDPEERQTLQDMIERGELPPLSFEQARQARGQGASRSIDATYRGTDRPINIRDRQRQNLRDTIQSEVSPERRRQLLDDARRLADQDNPLPSEDDPRYEEAKASNIDLQDEQVREATRQDIYTRVNNLDTLNYQEVRQLANDLARFRPTNLFTDEDEINNLSSRVGERLANLELEEKAIEELERQGYINPPQWMIDQVIEQRRPQKKPSQVIQNLRTNILKSEIENPEERLEDIRDNFINLKRYVDTLIDSASGPDKTLSLDKTTLDKLESIRGTRPENMSEDEIRDLTSWLTDVGDDKFNMQQYFNFLPSEQRGRRGVVQSLEDLAELIIEAQDHRFAPGQKFEIINRRGEIVKENFISWIRSSIVSLHHSNPDKVINPFSDITIPTAWRDINFNTIVSTPAYFQKRKMIITGEQGKGGRVEYVNTADDEYNKLKDSMLMEAWLFGESHSDDATYRSVRGRESDLFSAIGKMYEYNVFTKNDRIQEHVLRFAKTDRVKGETSELQRFLEEGEQGSVGKAIRRSLVSYYYLAELAFSDQIPPEDNPFLKAMGPDGMKYFWQSIAETMMSKSFSREINDTMKNFTPGDEEEDLSAVQKVLRHPDRYNTLSEHIKGKYGITPEIIQRYQDNPEELALALMGNINGWGKKDLNIFDKVDKDKRIMDMVHQAIADASGRVNNLSHTDSDYAGLWTQSMINWTGIAARNDTLAIGFDAWSKLLNFGPYRLRQGSGRSGPGNMYSMPGLKRLSLTLFDGLQVFSDYDPNKDADPGTQREPKTFMEALQGGSGNNINLDNDLDHFHFNSNAQSQFAANHIGNAKSMMDFVLDKMEYKLRDLFKTDPATGMLIFNHEAGHKIMDEYWKNIRYALDQPNFLYDKEIWDWEQVIDYDSNGKPKMKDDGTIERKLVFKKQKIRDHMFNKEVNNLDMYNGKHQSSKIARNVFAYLIAKEILAHRKWDSGYERWSINDIQAVEAFFEHFPNEIFIGEDNEDGDLVDVEMVKGFFSEEEWHKILGLIKSSYGKMWTIEGLSQLAGALVGGTIEMVRDTGKQAFKSAA